MAPLIVFDDADLCMRPQVKRAYDPNIARYRADLLSAANRIYVQFRSL